MPDLYGFDAATAFAIREMVRQWEGNGNRLEKPGRLPPSPGPGSPVVEILEVTDATPDPDLIGTINAHTARVQVIYDEDFRERGPVDVLVTSIDNRALEVGDRVQGRLMQRLPDGRLLFAGVSAPAAGNDARGITIVDRVCRRMALLSQDEDGTVNLDGFPIGEEGVLVVVDVIPQKRVLTVRRSESELTGPQCGSDGDCCILTSCVETVAPFAQCLVPDKLYVTLSDSGTCPALDGLTFEMTYIPTAPPISLWRWRSEPIAPDVFGPDVFWELTCDGSWDFFFLGGIVWDSVACNPFELTATGQILIGSGPCMNAFDITVTE